MENLKVSQFAKFKDGIIGYLAGTDTCSKINILNHRLNQVNFYFKIKLNKYIY